jgi:3-oxo-4,17-pregnadiene-20-carboxyl-CoA hydratase alpha subunit
MSDPSRKREELEGAMRAFVGRDAGSSVAADAVNEAMIRHFCAVVGDRNPVYSDPEAAARSVHGGVVAPPALLDAWTMPPYVPPWDDPDAPPVNGEQELHQLMGRHGYTGVVATDYDVAYRRYLRPGDRVHATKTIEAISPEKSTPLGVGYFIDVRWVFRDQAGEEVGTVLFRTLRYRPAQAAQPVSSDAPSAPTRLRPPLGHDNSWWWEAIERGELRIQRCSACGTLRHPPRPMCGQCQSLAWDSVVSEGAGSVYSYTVLHHPPVPGYPYPLAVGLVELDEGTRIVANVVDCEPSEVYVGMRVQARVEPVDEQMKLPLFHPVR